MIELGRRVCARQQSERAPGPISIGLIWIAIGTCCRIGSARPFGRLSGLVGARLRAAQAAGWLAGWLPLNLVKQMNGSRRAPDPL